MHYYQFNIGDYVKHTTHLTQEEDLAYRRLLDMYYDTEHQIPTDIPLVSRRLRMSADVVESVLKEFFSLTEEGYKNHRADAEISEYHAYLDKQKANGKKGGRPKGRMNTIDKTHGIPTDNPTANPELTQNNPKQETLNTNHKPLTNIITQPAKAVAIKKQKAELSLPDLINIGFDEQISEDYLALRKAKRAPLTKTALIHIVQAGAEVGLNPNQTLTYCINSTWAGFKKEWYLKDNQAGQRVSVISDFLKDPDFDF